MREDLGRMAQHFENLRETPKAGRVRYVLAGVVVGLVAALVAPTLAARAIVWLGSL